MGDGRREGRGCSIGGIVDMETDGVEGMKIPDCGIADSLVRRGGGGWCWV